MIDTESAFYQKATGMNITDATRLFQRCVLQKGKLDFEGNPDLGGIGVLISLTITCIVGTIGNMSLVIFSHLHLQQNCQHRIWWCCRHMESQTPGNRNEPTSVARTFTEMESALGSLLESVLFLALLVQIAAALVYLPGGNISQYEGTLIMYTAMIPVSPVLTLINTPGFLKAIRLRKFHLAITILVVGLAGGVIFRGTEDLLSNEAKLDKAVAENKPDPFRCGSSFLMRIMPAAFEAKILRCFWVLAAVGLIFAVDLYVGIRNEEKDANGGGGEGATIEEREPTKQTRKTASVVFWTLYFPVYVGLQFLQFFLLSRIYWMRKMVYNIINPNIAVKYEADIGKYHDQFVTARNDWADDKWGFGQIMSLSLWLPTIMEMVYLIIRVATTILITKIAVTQQQQRLCNKE